MWPFGSKTFLDPDEEAWQLQTWVWLLEEWGGPEDLARSPLVLPTREFFPPTDAEGHARAEHVFGTVKALCGMEAWPCRLVAQTERGGRVAEFVHLVHEHAALGTFSHDGTEAVVTYDPASLSDPLQLVATFAHELAHYRLASRRTAPPGGEELEEPATDLAAAYLGFGVFGANAAFRFQQHGDAFSQGWSGGRSGYLGERHWVFALAVFCAMTGADAAAARARLKPSLQGPFAKACAYLEKRPELLEPLRAARPADVEAEAV
jgi:hypothetical protein